MCFFRPFLISVEMKFGFGVSLRVLLSWLGSMVSIFFCVLMMYTWSYPCVVFLAYMHMSAKSLKLRNDFLLDFSLILYE